jgi:hypothetical protein
MPERDGEPHGAAGVRYHNLRCWSPLDVNDDGHQGSSALYPHSRITLPVLEATPSSSSSTLGLARLDIQPCQEHAAHAAQMVSFATD